jgi:hypothetical protein
MPGASDTRKGKNLFKVKGKRKKEKVRKDA